jgi:peptide-methionine (S)-S-oxide reductase
MERATFAAGCFWGVEAEFRKLEGVASTRVGYVGGSLSAPTYEDVCSDTTGHAEAVEIEFDSTVIGYEDLLEAFWSSHDPTSRNRQGADVGSQYRSGIFFHSPEQQAAATASRDRIEAEGRLRGPVVTEITPASTFWEAEAYHQQYLEKRGLASCRI